MKPVACGAPEESGLAIDTFSQESPDCVLGDLQHRTCSSKTPVAVVLVGMTDNLFRICFLISQILNSDLGSDESIFGIWDFIFQIPNSVFDIGHTSAKGTDIGQPEPMGRGKTLYITCMSIEGRLPQAKRIAQTLSSSIVSPELTTLYIQEYWIQLRDNLSLVRHRADWKDREETNISDLIHKQGSLPSEYRIVVSLRLLVPLYHQIYQHYISSTGYS